MELFLSVLIFFDIFGLISILADGLDSDSEELSSELSPELLELLLLLSDASLEVMEAVTDRLD